MTVYSEHTDQFVLLKHRDGQKCPYAPQFDGCDIIRFALFNVSLFRRKIGDVNRRFGRYRATDRSFRTGTKR